MKYVIILLLIILVLISGCNKEVIENTKTNQCEDLALKYDEYIKIGCPNLGNTVEKPAGATITEIQEPYFVDMSMYNAYPDEYHYKIKLKGINQEHWFLVMSKYNISLESLPYKKGQFYQFDFIKICGLPYSAGPHGGGYSFLDNNFEFLKSIQCLN